MPEVRLIDANALIKKICGNECGSVYDEECENAACNFYDYIMDAPAVNRWIPCSERLPKQSGFYLAYFTFKDGTHATDIAYINTGCHLGSITHWMPLPEPPEKE